jgi:hypothetical protein
MGTVVLDSGAVTRLADGSGVAVSLVSTLVERGWHLVVPATVLVECLTGDTKRDVRANRVLNAVHDVRPTDEPQARAAAALRFRSGNPSVVDALVAEMALRLPGAVVVLTTDTEDMETLVGRAPRVRVLSS